MSEIWSPHFLSCANISIFKLLLMLAEFKIHRIPTKCIKKKVQKNMSHYLEVNIIYSLCFQEVNKVNREVLDKKLVRLLLRTVRKNKVSYVIIIRRKHNVSPKHFFRVSIQ